MGFIWEKSIYLVEMLTELSFPNEGRNGGFMKRLRKFCSIILMCSLIITAIPMQGQAATKLTNVKNQSFAMMLGSSFVLKTNTKASQLSYQTNKKKVVTVDAKGRCIAKKIGNAKITITNTKT